MAGNSENNGKHEWDNLLHLVYLAATSNSSTLPRDSAEHLPAKVLTSIRQKDISGVTDLAIKSELFKDEDGTLGVRGHIGEVVGEVCEFFCNNRSTEHDAGNPHTAAFLVTIGNYHGNMAKAVPRYQRNSPSNGSPSFNRLSELALICYLEAWNNYVDAPGHEPQGHKLVVSVPALAAFGAVQNYYKEHDADNNSTNGSPHNFGERAVSLARFLLPGVRESTTDTLQKYSKKALHCYQQACNASKNQIH